MGALGSIERVGLIFFAAAAALVVAISPFVVRFRLAIFCEFGRCLMLSLLLDLRNFKLEIFWQGYLVSV